MIFHNIDGVDIPFDTKWKNIGIAVSGGADSALLSYLVCTFSKDSEYTPTIHIVSHVRCWKTKPWQQSDAEYVFRWLTQKFYHIKFERHTNFIAPELEYANTGPTLKDEYGKNVSGDNIQQRAFAEYICKSKNIDAYYNAVTRNPKDVDLGGMIERDIDRTEENKHLEIIKHMDVTVLHPFRFVSKDWVVAQYKRLGLIELFNKTRSCEGTFDHLDYTNYNDQDVPVCGKCFWCREREWAVNKNV